MSSSSSSAPRASPKSFYFVTRGKSQEGANLSRPSSRAGQGEELHSAPLPRSQREAQNSGVFSGVTQWVNGLFRRSDHAYQPIDGQKIRKVPVKVEPKVFFANERTFLAWLHMSVTLASISVAIVAFAEANAWSQIYGLLMMPVAIAFCGYSLWQYIKRAGMIRRKDPGPYEDRMGPVFLASLLAVAILINFGVKLYDYST